MKNALIALLLLLPLTANAQDTDVSLFLGGARLEKNTIIAFLPGEFDLDLELGFENSRAIAVGINHFWRPNVSTEFSILGLSTDPTLTVNTDFVNASFDIGDIRVGAITATGQWHFQRDARVSPYLGAGLAVLSGEIESDFEDEFGEVAGTSADFEVAAAILFNGGVNFRINERWLFGIDLKAIPYSPEVDDPPVDLPEEEIVVTDELEMNPLIVTFGVRYRF